MGFEITICESNVTVLVQRKREGTEMYIVWKNNKVKIMER